MAAPQPECYYCAACHTRGPRKDTLHHNAFIQCEKVAPIRIAPGTYHVDSEGRLTCATCGLSGGTLGNLACHPNCTAHGDVLLVTQKIIERDHPGRIPIACTGAAQRKIARFRQCDLIEDPTARFLQYARIEDSGEQTLNATVFGPSEGKDMLYPEGPDSTDEDMPSLEEDPHTD